MADDVRSIKVGGINLPAGAKPANRVLMRNVSTGEEKLWYTIDRRDYKGKEWQEVRPVSGDEIAAGGARPAAPEKVATEVDADPDETGKGDASDPWILWTDDQMRKAAKEVGVKNPAGKTRQALGKALSDKGVDPSDAKPE